MLFVSDSAVREPEFHFLTQHQTHWNGTQTSDQVSQIARQLSTQQTTDRTKLR